MVRAAIPPSPLRDGVGYSDHGCRLSIRTHCGCTATPVPTQRRQPARAKPVRPTAPSRRSPPPRARRPEQFLSRSTVCGACLSSRGINHVLFVHMIRYNTIIVLVESLINSARLLAFIEKHRGGPSAKAKAENRLKQYVKSRRMENEESRAQASK
jgi:hypothetical protein